ncbi:MAG: PepSY-like domain-containing protein [Bacteroidales bacterium]|nr:PepSY-like domain-containing protein [Bacteroidales bacterium]
MKHIYSLIFILFACLTSCQDSDNYRSLADPVATFVSQYWPNADIESYTHPTSGSYIVIIKNGPKIVFDSSMSWTEIDGNGMPLPQVLLYDQLPSPLYRYLEETENTSSVFMLERTPRQYSVTLLNSSLTYDISTGELKGN